MDSEDLSFYGSDPGAVKFGNFINYYSFHSPKQRIDNLNPRMFPTYNSNDVLLCLDIGCNTGDLSIELYSYLNTVVYPDKDIHLLAIDIDPVLIHRAQETHSDSNTTFMSSNIMDEVGRKDVAKYLSSRGKLKFDVVFCFSVTMWIHLNNGDEGLMEFLRYIKDISQAIIIEPQPWKCYKNAQRRMKKSGNSFPLYETLKIKECIDHVIENILTESSHRKVCESSESSWNRKVQSYQR